ncbi:MAG: T9SS type A sorting domain-containing protein [Bacteroidetes bacterium]|nr:T9SS type A sorting domain-containing protein [Bacteroidota bacterium]
MIAMKQTLPPIMSLLLLAGYPNDSCVAADQPSSQSKQSFVSLTVESTGWSAELFWNAIFDKNLISFAVQRSANGVDYQDIIKYEPYFLATGDTQTFREQDLNPKQGENFYRVRFTLEDGEQIFSERCKVYFKEITAFEIFPNPTGRQVNLLLKKFRGEPVEVLIFDSIGEQVYQQQITAVDDGMLRIELESMNAGIYSVCVVHKGQTFTRRLVVTSNDG